MVRRRAPGAGLLVAAACCAFALAGCATWFPPPQTAALRAAVPAGLPQRAERADIPFFAQTPYHCGPAALATALVHAGVRVTPDELGEQIFLPAREGTLQAEMLAGARRHGALAVRLPRELAAVLREAADGRPVVVLQNLGLSIAPRWHYAVVVGFDLARGEIVLRSGTTQREVMSLATFEHTWARGGHWAFVALLPGELPATAQEDDAAQAAVGFERVAAPPQAARAYDSVLARWPHNLVAAIGLGHARHAQGDMAGAAGAFEAAAQQHDSAAAWNNLARVRLELGQRDAALAAARRALARAESVEPQWLASARATLAQVRQQERAP